MSQKDTKTAPEVSAAWLKAEHPDVFDEIAAAAFAEAGSAAQSQMSEAVEAARSEGATAERERIQSVLAQAIPGHEALARNLAFDGKTTAAEAAIAILNAEREQRTNLGDKMRSETPAPVPSASSSTGSVAKPQIDNTLPVEERCKAQWDSDASIRAEFHSFDAFVSFTRAEENGQVKRLIQRSADK